MLLTFVLETPFFIINVSYIRETCSKNYFLNDSYKNNSVNSIGKTSGVVVLQYDKATDSPLFECLGLCNSFDI